MITYNVHPSFTLEKILYLNLLLGHCLGLLVP
nr:MAG TPA: hypothetical protein [Caudoviricetes sp.]